MNTTKTALATLAIALAAGTTASQLTVEYLSGSGVWLNATTGTNPPATITGTDVLIDNVPPGGTVAFRIR